ncbi:hypothetical protein QAD02_001811 [Eretmocerus hayati]|uniref:Uncharacterized protein n=1 Tax=Eretmocerus hayati TaxID=131215 RepID=A0ACC2NHH6_9HYME|nr:hypothetical protein QAD02_001811 [Eretmocerus hayati]
MGDTTPLSGYITKIYVKNFVTYDEVVVKPGRHLNLMIGPNGTGKSSIASAIVLGLGGSPKTIGRVQHVCDFIKSGHNSAVIEIDLCKDANNPSGEVVKITRTFDQDNRSSWMINNKPVNYRNILEITKFYNIQVDNLCQFLPQDKVQHFSGLTSPALLRDTEKSVGDPKLLDNHDKLIQMRKDQSELEKDLAAKSKLYEKEKQTYESLKDSVGHINEQRAIKKKLNSLKQKKAWLFYQTKKAEFQKVKERKDEALAKKNKYGKQLKPIEQEISKLKESVQSSTKAAKQYAADMSVKRIYLDKLLDENEKLEASIADFNNDCESKIKDEQTRDSRIHEMREQLDKMQNDLRNLVEKNGTVDNLQTRLDEIDATFNAKRANLHEITTEREFLRNKIEEINRRIKSLEQSMREIENIETKRLEVLRRIAPDAYKGVIWLRSNKHEFSKPVHEPILLHINITNPQYSKYFESIINQQDLVAFVCEDKNDMNKLIRVLRQQQQLRINVVHSDPNRTATRDPKIPLQDIRRYGFLHYMSSIIDAPEIILKYLLNMYKLNEIPIGNNDVIANLERIPDGLWRFFSVDNLYSVSRSKYSGEKSTRQQSISGSGNLSITIDTQSLESTRNQIAKLAKDREQFSRQLDASAEKYAVANEKMENHKKIKAELRDTGAKMKNLEARINMSAAKIEKEQLDRKSVEEIRTEFKNQIKAKIGEQINKYCEYNQVLKDYYKRVILNEEFKFDIEVLKEKLTNKENSSQDLREKFEAAEADYKLLTSEVEPLKRELESSYVEAKTTTGGFDSNDAGFKPYANAFAKLPATIEELFDEIKKTQMKIFSLNNQQDVDRILERFNNAKRTMDQVKAHITEKEERLGKLNQTIEAIKDEWLPMLSSLVDKININFGNYFKKMKCAGEVSLITGDNPMDFEKYGIQIRVKFRNADDLQILNRNHQSGGERAVTTAVYMMSLQELSTVPFRCVDELNQGMDVSNERRIFELIVDITSRKNSPQYFLLTPKLLPNLTYTDAVTVLTVFNGKYMVPCSQFDMTEKCSSIVNTIVQRRSMVH